MEDNKLQIEEMTNFLQEKMFWFLRDKSTEMCERFAKKLLEHYQPKLPENAVVLTREELAKERELNRQIDREFVISEFNVQVRTSIEQARKETARECRDYIKKWAGNSEECLGFLFDFEDFIAKQYGAEVEE